ncbi:MAG: 1-deoxy-D-xylulose-5-phosphate reductoisomerase, partial [Pseudomonadota bacterium]
NKECLVSAGGLFLEATRRGGGGYVPVDSEHSAIFQSLDARADIAPSKFILTASGGPFRDWPLEKMARVTPAEARAHPTFEMGLKISIDSATMFNKALEMVEARWLFGATAETLDVVVHPQSVIHSAVSYPDGAMIAQLGVPDMRTAIGYALTYPARGELPVEQLDLPALARLDFQAPDEDRFPSLRLARGVMDQSELAGAALNAAKEAALTAFIDGRIGFLDMARIVETVLERLTPTAPARDVDDVFEMDRAARRLAESEMRLTAA